MACGGEDEGDCIAFRAAQEVAAEVAVALQVTDDGLDGAAAPPLAANGARDTAPKASLAARTGLVGIPNLLACRQVALYRLSFSS